MLFSNVSNKNKKAAQSIWNWLSVHGLLFVLFLIIIVLFSGCARWIEDGEGEKQKLLLIRVNINENGQISPDLGKYYIVFDTRENASQPPSQNRDEWENGLYYVKLDSIGFCFGKVGGICRPTSVGTYGKDYFQVNIPLKDLGNPNKIYMNIISTDKNDKTYDYIDNPIDLTINDTGTAKFNKTVQDFTGDFEGSPNFDIKQINIELIEVSVS